MSVLVLIRLLVAGFITFAASQESNVQEGASRVDLVTGVTFAEDHSKAKAGTLRGFYRTAAVLAKLTPIELAMMWLYHYYIQQSASIDSSKNRDTMNDVSDPHKEQEVNKEQSSISLNLPARAEDGTLKLMLTCGKVFIIALLARWCIKRSCASTEPCDLEAVMHRGSLSGLTRQRSPSVQRSSTTMESVPRKERRSNSYQILPAAPSNSVVGKIQTQWTTQPSSSASPHLADVMTPEKTTRRNSSRSLMRQVEKKETFYDWLEGLSPDPQVQRDAKRQEATMERPGVGVKCTNLLSSKMAGG